MFGCLVYKSLKKADTYVYVRDKLTLDNLPENVARLLSPFEYVMELDLDLRQSLANADVDDVKIQVKSQGFYLQLPPPSIV